jgi:hypothetical protein
MATNGLVTRNTPAADQAANIGKASALTHQELDNNFFPLYLTAYGTAEAKKALVCDENIDIGGIRNITITGTLSDGNYTFDTSGNVSGLGTVGCGAITSSGTSGFANITASGTLTVTGLATVGDLTFSQANPEILGGDTDGITYISAGATKDLGGNVLLYGDTHANGGDIVFRDDTTTELQFDASGSLWDFQANAVTTSGTITGGTLTDGTFSVNGGTISAGTWEGTTIAVDQGGTGQTSYTNGQLLIGNTTGNTLAKATLTAGTGIAITNGTGSITINSDLEGTELASTGEAGGTKFLREDGDGTCSWQEVSGTTVLSRSSTQSTVSGTTAGEVFTYTIPANTLQDDSSNWTKTLKFTFMFEKTAGTERWARFDVKLGGSTIWSGGGTATTDDMDVGDRYIGEFTVKPLAAAATGMAIGRTLLAEGAITTNANNFFDTTTDFSGAIAISLELDNEAASNDLTFLHGVVELI